MAEPNVAQFQLPKDINLAQDVTLRVSLTGAASESTDLTTDQLVAEVTPPASGVHTLNLPPLPLWKNRLAVFSQTASAPGGEIKIAIKESGADAVGDNLTAASDKAILFNFQGEKVIVIAETTT